MLASSRTRPAGVHASPAQQPSKRSSRESPTDLDSNNVKRVKTVTQACKDCRRNKAKCDGARPKCGTCIHKDRECGYEGEVGQSRQAAMRARLETLERLFDTLQHQTPEDAERLLQRIRSARSADGLSSVLSPDENTETSPTSSSSLSWLRGGRLPHLHSDASSRTTQPSSLGSGRLYSLPPTSSRAPSDTSDTTTLLRPMLPDRSLTTRAVDCFYACAGRLFQMFSKAQMSDFIDDIYAADGRTSSHVKKAICSVACVASIGIQYKYDDFPQGLGGVFYDVARHYFADACEDSPLDAIKDCTLLAMYNILNKVTVAVAYVEVGLGMFRRHCPHNRQYLSPGVSSPERVEYRTVWRCLIFFSTWLSSTLGYFSSEDVPLSALMPIAEAEMDSSADIFDTVQVEMTKISMLKADILRMHLAFKDLTGLAMKSIMADLQDWYKKLPPAMTLATLGQSDLPDNVRRSIYYVHLLHLGAIMLLYRRVASQYSRSHSSTSHSNPQRQHFEQLMLNHAEEGVLAAQSSARILGLLLGQLSCFRRCWIVIFQSYTSCVVLLHSIVQKQVHEMNPSSWAEDLPQAKTCLDILELCGTLDSVALKFHNRLFPVFLSLSRYTPPHKPVLSSTGSSAASQNAGCHCYDPGLEPHPFAFLLTIPKHADCCNQETVRLAVSLRRILSRPFDNPEDQEAVAKGHGLDTQQWVDDPAKSHREQDKFSWRQTGRNCAEAVVPPEKLDWGQSGGITYRWDAGELGLPEAIAVPTTRFLCSTTPSGWSSGA